jgi:hypothetical protein
MDNSLGAFSGEMHPKMKREQIEEVVSKSCVVNLMKRGMSSAKG